MISSKNFRYDENFYSMYAMGWGITAYRGHLLLSHGGGIDGFTASVSFMPRDNMGMVILTNKSGTPIPGIVLYNAYDRLLGLKTIDWNQRIRERTEKAKKEAEKAQKDKDKDRKTNTKTSHPLADFTGEYKNPGYGIFAVKQDGKGLKAVFNNIDYTMRHYHYDIFEIKNEMLDMKQKISFSTDLKGNITVLSIQLEPAVEAISFTRMADKKMKEHSFLKKFVGEYEYNNITVSIFFKGETNLFLRVPGQPEYELEPYKNTEFQLKGIPGISIEFVVDETGKVSEAIITQPEGVFHAQKK